MIVGREHVEDAADAIRQRWNGRPRAGLILGTGLSHLADMVEVQACIDYESIPHFPPATALAHRGRWICGTLAGVPVVVMDGRLHGYEGYSAARIAFPVRVMAALGAKLLIVSNACGGMNPNFRVGDVMVVEDHINLTWDNPLVGPHDVNPGVGYPDMSCPYDSGLIVCALSIARREGIVAHRGVYVGVKGPSYETRAEYRFLRRIGGDVVGMSTVPEVIVAAQCGLRVLALSVVTNVCSPDRLLSTDGTRVVAAAESSEPHVRAIVAGVIEREAASL